MEDRAVEEIKRHFDVVAESLKDEIKLIAEGHVLLNKKIDDLREDVDEFRKENTEEHTILNKRIDELRKENTEEHTILNERIDELRKENEEGHAVLSNRIDEFRKENAEEHGEILSAIKFSYAELDRRIVVLEDRFADIEKRVSRLESPH